jgi:hypothetical protein
MNILTLSAPQVNILLAAGFTSVRVFKSDTKTPTGPWSALTPDVALVADTTSYSFADAAGVVGDWYRTQYLLPPATLSSPSAPEPSYLSDLFAGVRDLLGVTSAELSDAQLLGFAFLPAAFAEVRKRLATFDTVLAAGGDAGAACLSALTYLLASLAASRMASSVMDSERFGQYMYTRHKALDWTKTQENLRCQYETLISQAAGEDVNSGVMVPGMVLAGPTRGGYDTTGGLVPFNPVGGVTTPKPSDD